LIKEQKINVTVPGYEDDVVNDEILEFLSVDELLVQAFPLVLRSGDVWEKIRGKYQGCFKMSSSY
jgi:hypothetical protein